MPAAVAAVAEFAGVCYSCKRVGHRASECPVWAGRCFACRGRGHLSSCCPRRSVSAPRADGVSSPPPPRAECEARTSAVRAESVSSSPPPAAHCASYARVAGGNVAGERCSVCSCGSAAGGPQLDEIISRVVRAVLSSFGVCASLAPAAVIEPFGGTNGKPVDAAAPLALSGGASPVVGDVCSAVCSPRGGPVTAAAPLMPTTAPPAPTRTSASLSVVSVACGAAPATADVACAACPSAADVCCVAAPCSLSVSCGAAPATAEFGCRARPSHRTCGTSIEEEEDFDGWDWGPDVFYPNDERQGTRKLVPIWAYLADFVGGVFDHGKLFDTRSGEYGDFVDHLVATGGP
jgi:hypothetical protein